MNVPRRVQLFEDSHIGKDRDRGRDKATTALAIRMTKGGRGGGREGALAPTLDADRRGDPASAGARRDGSFS